MQVMIDGAAWRGDLSDCANLAELIAKAEAHQEGQADCVVVSVLVDGEPVPIDEMSRLEGCSLDGVDRIEIDRRTSLSVARSVLLQGANYTQEISSAIEQVVEHYQGSRNELGNNLLANITDSLNVLIGITGSVAEVLTGQTETLSRLQEEIVPWLEEMIEAQLAGDVVRLSDILDYEIKPRIEVWGTTMRGIAEVIAEE